MTKVLIVGSGGREHALAYCFAQDSRVEDVFVAPGNAGTAREPKARNVPIDAVDVAALRAFAAEQRVDMTVIGPEQSLQLGIRDAFDRDGLTCFAPSRLAAQLETSKSFAKAFMARHDIPTARHAAFDDLDAARAYVRDHALPVVLKADGIAAGKGVVIAASAAEACEVLEQMLSGRAFGDAGRRVVIEEFLEGEEASFIVVADGDTVVPLASSQDHKRIFDGDEGPNTGGMGAYSPAPVITPAVHERVLREVVAPTLRGMVLEGHPYQGFLYVGLMIDGRGAPKVIEFNCRLGDPEAEPLLMRLQSPLLDVCTATLDGSLRLQKLRWDDRPAVAVVMASGGYPGSFDTGIPIDGLDAADQIEDVKVFHAGTATNELGQVVTNGGRVLCVVGVGDSIGKAQRKAYEGVSTIRWDHEQHRSDIADRGLVKR